MKMQETVVFHTLLFIYHILVESVSPHNCIFAKNSKLMDDVT